MRLRRTPPPIVRVDEDALKNACVVASERLPRETGGILIGYRQEELIYIRYLIEVPDEEAGCSSYLRRYAAAESALGGILQGESEISPLGYVGEWHTHPGRIGASSRDIREICQIAKKASEAIALIVLKSRAAQESWEPQVLTVVRKRHELAELQVDNRLPGNGEDGYR